MKLGEPKFAVGPMVDNSEAAYTPMPTLGSSTRPRSINPRNLRPESCQYMLMLMVWPITTFCCGTVYSEAGLNRLADMSIWVSHKEKNQRLLALDVHFIRCPYHIPRSETMELFLWIAFLL